MKKSFLIVMMTLFLFSCGAKISSENSQISEKSQTENTEKPSQAEAKTEVLPIKTFSYHFPDG